MRDIKLLIFLVLFPAIAYTQAYYDAVDIAAELNPAHKVNIQSESMIALLAPYAQKQVGESATLEEVVAAFEGNPFIQVSDGNDELKKKSYSNMARKIVAVRKE